MDKISTLKVLILCQIRFFISSPIKNPVFMRKTGFLYATLHSLPPKTYCEAHSGGCSDFRIILLWPEVLKTSGILAPSHPDPSTLRYTQGSGRKVVALAGFVPDYSGVAIPDSHGIPLLAISHLNTYSNLFLNTTILKWMSN